HAAAVSALLLSAARYLLFACSATPTTAIYTLSLHDALPIFSRHHDLGLGTAGEEVASHLPGLLSTVALRQEAFHSGALSLQSRGDRKSTRLNSSHVKISYAVFCLKKKRRPARESP